MGVGGRVAVDELGAGDDDDVDGAGEGGGVDVLVVLVGGTDGADGPAEVVHEGESLWQESVAAQSTATSPSSSNSTRPNPRDFIPALPRRRACENHTDATKRDHIRHQARTENSLGQSIILNASRLKKGVAMR